MNASTSPAISPAAALLAGGGALVVSFSLSPRVRPGSSRRLQHGAEPAKLPGSLDDDRFLDAWIRIDADGKITVFTGKAELGQGIRTALLQVAAEELDVEPADIKLVTADTGPHAGRRLHRRQPVNAEQRHRNPQRRRAGARDPDRRGRAPARASHADRSAAPKARRSSRPTAASVGYGELVADHDAACRGAAEIEADRRPMTFRVIGKSLPRVDIPAKVTGGVAYVQDLRLDGMVHARVVRPPSHGARSPSVDSARSRRCPAWSRSCATATSSPSSPRASSRRSRRCARSPRLRAGTRRKTLPDPDRALPTTLQGMPRARGRHRRGGQAPAFDGRQDARGDLHAALPDPRLDRPVLRRRV